MEKSVHTSEYKRLLTRLKKAREEAGLTQTQVTTALGRKHQSFMAKVEAGDRRLDVIELLKLARLYKKHPTYFYE